MISATNLIKTGLKSLNGVINKNIPLIFHGISVVCYASSIGFAIKGTILAKNLIDEKEESIQRKLTLEETAKTVWKCYIPTVVTTGVGIVSIIYGYNVNNRRMAALASLYSISETALKEYQDKTVELLGKGKETKIKDEICKDVIQNNPVQNSNVIVTGDGDVLCYDCMSGRYFKSSIEKIRRIQNDLNKELVSDIYGWVSLNDLYFALGLDAINLGYEMGWTTDDMLDIQFSSQLSSDGTPCLVMTYKLVTQFK